MIPDELKEKTKSELQRALVNPVKLLMFTQELECKFCSETRQLLQELAVLSDKITIETYDLMTNADKAKAFNIDKVPAIVVMGEKDYGIRIYGMPYGYEFQTLLAAVVAVSRRETDISETTKSILKEIKTPVKIQVFVTLTCPYCPIMASMAHKFAMENDLIEADAVDAGEFPQLAIRYMVMGVPKTVINDKVEFVGALPEDAFLQQVLQAIGEPSQQEQPPQPQESAMTSQ
jgi:glutaredoxin-like protein